MEDCRKTQQDTPSYRNDSIPRGCRAAIRNPWLLALTLRRAGIEQQALCSASLNSCLRYWAKPTKLHFAFLQRSLSAHNVCVCVCVCRQKTRLFAVYRSKSFEIALYRSASQFIFFERCLESRKSLLSSAMAMGF